MKRPTHIMTNGVEYLLLYFYNAPQPVMEDVDDDAYAFFGKLVLFSSSQLARLRYQASILHCHFYNH